MMASQCLPKTRHKKYDTLDGIQPPGNFPDGEARGVQMRTMVDAMAEGLIGKDAYEQAGEVAAIVRGLCPRFVLVHID